MIGPAPLLGRNCLVAPGQSTPEAWQPCERLTVALDDDSLPPVLSALAHERRAVVLAVADEVETALNRPSVTSRPPYELGARFPMPREALRALVFANSVDCRRATPGWWLLDAAHRLGARAVDDGRGDVALTDGTRLWLDGGPPRFTAPIDGIGVLHRVCVEHGSLAPPLGNGAAATIVGDGAELEVSRSSGRGVAGCSGVVVFMLAGCSTRRRRRWCR